MNITQYTDSLSHISPASIPATLWALYVEYLWNYESDSWVARIAYSCRILAFLISLPIIILGLLDIASYGIARTLGVIDDVKASTSDKVAVDIPPTIRVDAPDSLSGDSLDSSWISDGFGSGSGSTSTGQLSALSEATKPDVFYAEEDNNLKLSGVGVFSPAASQPPSPTISRHHLPLDESKHSKKDNLRHRTVVGNHISEETD
ncbi:hypothetical protein CVT24_004849 [Panaeolus cyanescens]|uniref:Uncharacterized protein n=1 Tax=Panaeolus cyanescens TaxID=181874 RepID=A0A409VQC1_9AGAR|nr:hypothetical protein CVT24_004849 [Panaeolus cyanescens]